MATNQYEVVKRVNNSHPELLQWNSHSSCAEFLQRVCAEPEMKAERWGLLSKSDGENGYTFPNGIRTSHDVIALPNGERIDIIQSAGGHPQPAGPAWGIIPPDQWRPSNVYVDISGWPIYDSDAPSDVIIPNDTTLAFGWFCWMTAWDKWEAEAKENYKWIMDNINPRIFRVMLAVEGKSHGEPDVWRDAGVLIDSGWEDRFKRMLDQVGEADQQVHCTVYGGRNQTPTYTDRYRFHDRIVAACNGRWEAIRSFEMMNEYVANYWTAEEVRDAGLDLGKKLPSGSLLSLSSPTLAHGYINGREATNEEMQASFDILYKDHKYANEVTIHTMRDGGKWSDPFSYNMFYPELPHINNEPPGPGTSAGGMYTTGDDVYRDMNNTIKAGWIMYVGHSEWCVWNGHLPVEYHNGWREVSLVWELPNMSECAHAMNELNTNGPDSGTGGDEEMIAYDEAKSVEFGTECNKVYEESGATKDPGMVSVHSSRAAWDYYVGKMSWEDSLHKHINEFRAEYGLAPLE